MLPIASQLGPQSFQSIVELTIRSKSLMSIPFAVKRGRQWLAAIWTRLCSSAVIRILLDLPILLAPGTEPPAFVVIGKGVWLRAGELRVKLGAPVVRLTGAAEKDLPVPP